jgi:hypothetical protein
MIRFLNIAKVNLKYHLLPHILVAIGLCIFSPFIMGVNNLDKYSTARILEVYISLQGIILFVPIFYPDQDRDTRDLIRSKKESISIIHCIRFLMAFLTLIILVSSYLLFLKYSNCQFPFSEYLYGTIANSIFLGGLGIFVYSFIDNLPIAYMVPILYYILCYGAGKQYLGKFYLFSMLGGSAQDKIYLFIAGIIMISVGIYIRMKK